MLVSNRFVYTPAVQRVLQLAANIYDATTNRSLALGADFPSVFRPTFWVTNDTASGYTNVYINGYEPVEVLSTASNRSGPSRHWRSQLDLPVDVTAVAPTYRFRNFHECECLWRAVDYRREEGFPEFQRICHGKHLSIDPQAAGHAPTLTTFTSQCLSVQPDVQLSISNQFGVECWNSYSSSNLSGV